jgi:ADP-ribose pyrophosphatase YjhB (NUDIX family)
MDLVVFTASAATAWILWRKKADNKEKRQRSICYVNADNEPAFDDKELTCSWYRATYTLVMHEPPHLFYEPKEWSQTSVLLVQNRNTQGHQQLELPGGPVLLRESYEEAAVQQLKEDTHIDVCRPENCLHHLFTFPFEFPAPTDVSRHGVWGDFYECVYRGRIEDLSLENPNFVCMSLAELKDALEDENEKDSFAPDTHHALKLYFQRQGDLRAKLRLLKGYSSVDLQHYGLRSETPLVLMDFNDDARAAAVDYTMKTDDGMAPRLLHQAELIVLGVSRVGKTPLCILIAQTMGLKVANIPLVLELNPPKQLTDDDRIDPKRVFCLTLQPDYLQKIRMTRMRRELKKQLGQGRSKYADVEYVKKDVLKAKELCYKHGYTEIDVSGRAIEETASLIVTKLKERFPDTHIA